MGMSRNGISLCLKKLGVVGSINSTIIPIPVDTGRFKPGWVSSSILCLSVLFSSATYGDPIEDYVRATYLAVKKTGDMVGKNRFKNNGAKSYKEYCLDSHYLRDRRWHMTFIDGFYRITGQRKLVFEKADHCLDIEGNIKRDIALEMRRSFGGGNILQYVVNASGIMLVAVEKKLANIRHDQFNLSNEYDVEFEYGQYLAIVDNAEIIPFVSPVRERATLEDNVELRFWDTFKKNGQTFYLFMRNNSGGYEFVWFIIEGRKFSEYGFTGIGGD